MCWGFGFRSIPQVPLGRSFLSEPAKERYRLIFDDRLLALRATG